MFTFKVPAGIGDLSWVYSKLCNFDKPFRLKISNDEPKRTLPFAQLLPKAESVEYDNFSYWPTFVTHRKGLPADTDLNALPEGEYFLSANIHLESGARIERFLPTLPINYHYEFKDLAEYNFRQFLASQKVIGVYPSKYANYRWNNDWTFWSVNEWAEFLFFVQEQVGGECTFVFLGAEFDNDLGNDIQREVAKYANTVNLIAKTHIGEVISLMHRFNYLFAYASGIGILGDVVNVPTMHFIPTPKHDTLIDSYADPANIESGRHLNVKFCPVETAKSIFLNRGKQFV